MNKEEVVQLNKLKRKTGLFFIIVMGVMLICFIFLIQFEVNKEKISASYTAEDTVRKIETQLGRYLEILYLQNIQSVMNSLISLQVI